MHFIVANIFNITCNMNCNPVIFWAETDYALNKIKTIIQLQLHALIQNWLKIYIKMKKKI